MYPSIEFLPETRRSYAACPVMPEFSFSPKKGRRIARRWVDEHEPIPPQQGPMVPPMVSNPRKLHEPRKLNAVEQAHHDLKPWFKTPIEERETLLQPMGSLEGIDHFIARVQRRQLLIDQQARDDATNRILIEQEKELPTMAEEFAANGLTVFSLSSSRNDGDDDDLEPANLTLEHDAIRYGTPMKWDPITLAPVTRRLEWEHYITQCSVESRVYLDIVDEQLAIVSPSKTLPEDEAAKMGKRLWKAMGKPDIETLKDAIGFAKYAPFIGSKLYGVTKGEVIPEQSFDDLGADEQAEPQTTKQGPQELGLHWLDIDLGDEAETQDYAVLSEGDGLFIEEFDWAV